MHAPHQIFHIQAMEANRTMPRKQQQGVTAIIYKEISQGPELRMGSQGTRNKAATAACDTVTEDQLGKRQHFWMTRKYLRDSYITHAHWLISQLYLPLLTLYLVFKTMLAVAAPHLFASFPCKGIRFTKFQLKKKSPGAERVISNIFFLSYFQ